MDMLIAAFIAIPLVGFLLSLFIPARRERLISGLAFSFAGVLFLSSLAFTSWWILAGPTYINVKELVLYSTGHYEFYLDFYFDKVTAVYWIVGSMLSFMVTIYSSYYLHREPGYKRYFNTILFFLTGYMIAIFAGNLETLFLGWELLGVSSFLLIAFYRERYLPVKNAVKIFSLYRIGDVGILLAMWMSHHLWQENIAFVKLLNYDLVDARLEAHSSIGVFISVMILLSAAVKSAQVPFTSWLPRAMEGPTPSSAIFYGSLAVHMGTFLMIRTFPFWEHQVSVRILAAAMGLATALIATGIARVQSSVKSQIAYSSAAQIGLMFIEVALGWTDIALLHFAGNAFLRTYQLLVSPSVVSYLIREQFYTFSPHARSVEDRYPSRLRYTLYALCLKEFNMDNFMYRYLWNPIKWLGKKLDFLNLERLVIFFVPSYIMGILAVMGENRLPDWLRPQVPLIFALIGLTLVVKSFAERKRVRMSWLMIPINHFWVALAISFNEHFEFDHTLLYLSGIVASGIVGYATLTWLRRKEGNIDLDQFHGYVRKYPKTAFIFLLCCLGVAGFPITTTFVGEDLIISHIHEDQWLLAAVVALSLIVDGLSAIRIYARTFLGPHTRMYQEVAQRSA